MTRYLSCFLLFLSLLLFSRCVYSQKGSDNSDTFNWNAGLSAPKNYPSGAPSVQYFYKKEKIAAASLGTGANQGWGETSGGFVGGEVLKPVPDSMAVKWVCSVDNLVYKSGFKLDRENILAFFKKGIVDSFGNQVEYTEIVTGTAPGGNVCVWLKAGQSITQVGKFKVKEGVEDPNIDADYKKKDVKSWGNYLTYWKIHGIPYDSWEKGNPTYKYDIAYTTEEEATKNFSMAISGLSKDGSVVYADGDLKFLEWDGNPALDSKISNKKLPVQFYMQWISRDQKEWYEAQIVFPNDFEKQFLDFENKYGKGARIILGMEKRQEGNDFSFGKIWLQNPQGKQEIMRFRAAKLDYVKRDYKVSKYSLPKNFAFPKWEGKVALVFPDFDFWQEK